eukprot:CAMPEP_0197657364 /NCGR_PEP_ID=MMETSP1338-20131121/44580_1 /TAXON_ID=43686 ORGANISM="Pelagodinium beii, Strain RCC1491" /NCGR_SAMPLE_ID=MMETSP1338 /ASSEMBLY_ACC=CAM_ASM_000754 /LENGTH=198 /DNA_ID=CAMNT_0043233711 /DNA_START=65 /DNA_END=661 /DNA_ORIENTATION=-
MEMPQDQAEHGQAVPRSPFSPCPPQGPRTGVRRRTRASVAAHQPGQASPEPCGAPEESSGSMSTQSHPVAWVRALRMAAMSLASGGCSEAPGESTIDSKTKARAVAVLQRLFFEELAKGQDANGAAAQALRRLMEQPLSAFESPDAEGSKTSEAVVPQTTTPSQLAVHVTPVLPAGPKPKAEGRRPNPVGQRRIAVQT